MYIGTNLTLPLNENTGLEFLKAAEQVICHWTEAKRLIAVLCVTRQVALCVMCRSHRVGYMREEIIRLFKIPLNETNTGHLLTHSLSLSFTLQSTIMSISQSLSRNLPLSISVNFNSSDIFCCWIWMVNHQLSLLDQALVSWTQDTGIPRLSRFSIYRGL
jgi:hypothetical protein